VKFHKMLYSCFTSFTNLVQFGSLNCEYDMEVFFCSFRTGRFLHSITVAPSALVYVMDCLTVSNTD